jgi:hypothetical protein
VFDGDAYGLDMKLTHSGKPMVEFYDAHYEHTDFGQFVSRYYADTLLEGMDDAPGRGLCLDGGVPEWSVSGEALFRVQQWAKAAISAREAEPPLDRRWLSQYVGDIQRAFEEGDRIRVGELLFDANFNDRIYVAP